MSKLDDVQVHVSGPNWFILTDKEKSYCAITGDGVLSMSPGHSHWHTTATTTGELSYICTLPELMRALEAVRQSKLKEGG